MEYKITHVRGNLYKIGPKPPTMEDFYKAALNGDLQLFLDTNNMVLRPGEQTGVTLPR